ncbi:MAG: aminoacyl-tRNA hydrolase [Gammaproteobacteria bacterium]
MTAIALIVGLGNPGPEYQLTRHNAGFWFVDELAVREGGAWKREARFHGELARCRLDGHDVRLFKPTTFMNLSGQAVSALAGFFRIAPEQMLVVHDDLDLPPGTVRLKRGGGHGGHNGLRDLIGRLGSRDFLRLRLGIGHPGQRGGVVNYVLQRPSRDDVDAIESAIVEGIEALPLVLAGEMERAMHRLHSR